MRINENYSKLYAILHSVALKSEEHKIRSKNELVLALEIISDTSIAVEGEVFKFKKADGWFIRDALNHLYKKAYIYHWIALQKSFKITIILNKHKTNAVVLPLLKAA